jgi:putative transposase
MKYNPYKHHRRSIRLKGYDYSQDGAYFITLCAYNRELLFGDIIDQKMILNNTGQIAYDEWIKTAEMRPNIELGEFIIMTNHVHGIIIINNTEYCCRGTMHRAPTLMPHGPVSEQFGKPMSNTIPIIIRGYKSSLTKQINILRIMPGAPVWQHNYFERIIRDETEYYRIENYIKNNPNHWAEDKNNPLNFNNYRGVANATGS